MSRERITADLAEIVEGTARLVERRLPYETALADHVARMSAVGGLAWPVDNAHQLQ